MKFSIKLTFALIIVYGLLYLLYFWQTPLGQMPVLDGSENFALAHQIAFGSLPKEPFFRSMLYPALLAIPCALGFEDELFCIASLTGIIFHFFSSIFIFLIVKNLWKNDKAALLSSLIYGLYPPAVYFAAEPLDITLAISFMLSALYFYFLSIDKNEKKYFALSGISLGISGLLRSNVLPFTIIYIIYPIAIWYQQKKALSTPKESDDQKDSSNKDSVKLAIKNTLISLFTFSIVILSGSIIGYIHSGDFKLLPWQGAANFYSANNTRANGKFFKHSVYVADRKVGTNPTRAEAEYIYFKETGIKYPFNISEFNKFWIKKSFAEISANPTFFITLTLKKVYYLFNNYEQYNNKTFSFHKSITPSLRYNPNCFGFLLILFFLSLFNLKDITDRSKIYTLLTGIIALSGGVIAFYVSARFRLPLASLLTIVGAGIFRFDSKIINNKNIILVIVVSFLTFSTFFEAADTRTWKDDRLLNAFACSRLGLDEEQFLWANRVLEEEPDNLQAIRLKMVAFTNLALSGRLTDNKEWQKVEKELKFLSKNNLYFNDTVFLSACYAWKIENNKEKARLLWTNGGAESLQPELFKACLIYSGLLEPNESDEKMAQLVPLLFASLKGKANRTNVNKADIEKAQKALKFLIDQDK